MKKCKVSADDQIPSLTLGFSRYRTTLYVLTANFYDRFNIAFVVPILVNESKIFVRPKRAMCCKNVELMVLCCFSMKPEQKHNTYSNTT